MKTIKFNLILDAKPIRNIEQLRDNFCVEDILETYKNGLLEKWLKVRGYNDYLVKVGKLNKKNDKDIIKSLIDIFEMYVDEDDLESIMNKVDYVKTKSVSDSIDSCSYKFSVEEYHIGYEIIIEDIYENKNNIGKLKALFEEINEKYTYLFEMNYKDVLDNIGSEYVQVIAMLLSMDKIRDIIVSNKEIIDKLNLEIEKIKTQHRLQSNQQCKIDKSKLKNSTDNLLIIDIINKIKEQYADKIIVKKGSTGEPSQCLSKDEVIITDIIPAKDSLLNGKLDRRVKIYDLATSNVYPNKSAIGKVLNQVHIKTYNSEDIISYIPYSLVGDIENNKEDKVEELNNNLQLNTSNTEGYWKEIEDSKKNIMILHIANDSKVKCLKTDKIMLGKDIKDKFVILNGLEYNSKSNEPLIYMEV